jgi:hypothetical protein
MASYARQSGDREMRVMADRIQARALKRIGELIRQIPKATKWDQKSPEQLSISPREQARIVAGLSGGQAKDALAIDSIPDGRFEEAVGRPAIGQKTGGDGAQETTGAARLSTSATHAVP